jgi:protocatechuate 3,4-dioxygenase beta subunit
MTRRLRALLVAFAIAAASRSIAAQQNPQSLMPPGTGSISGRILAGDTGRPLAGALVEIVIYNNLSFHFRQVLTDDQGKFVFTELPAGGFQVQASASRYLAMQFGQLEPGPAGMLNPPRAIQLADKQQFADANFTLQRFGAIEGVITDERGDPAPNVSVQIAQILYAGGMRRLAPVNVSRDAGPVRPTDDLGHFRIGGLAPGKYYVTALAGAFADPSAAGGFAITFYPGTTDPAAAQTVTLPGGKDVADVSFSLVPAKTAVVAGTLVDEASAPLPRSTLMLMPADSGKPTLTATIRTVTGDQGDFAFRNVPPGDYTIQAFGKQPANVGNLGAAPFGFLTVHVGVDDTSHVTVHVPAPRTLRGRITFDDDAAPKPKSDSTPIQLRPVEFESSPMGGGPAPFTVHEDWTFEVSAMSGRRIVVPIAPAGWFLKSAQLNGQDVTDTPLDFRENDVNGLELVYTRRATTVNATLTLPEGRKVADYNVLVFSSDDRRWTIWSRYVSVARPNQQGAFVIRNLPPGQYVAVVVGSLSAGEWQDPEFLRQLRDGGTGVPFSLGEAATANVQLTAK